MLNAKTCSGHIDRRHRRRIRFDDENGRDRQPLVDAVSAPGWQHRVDNTSSGKCVGENHRMQNLRSARLRGERGQMQRAVSLQGAQLTPGGLARFPVPTTCRSKSRTARDGGGPDALESHRSPSPSRSAADWPAPTPLSRRGSRPPATTAAARSAPSPVTPGHAGESSADDHPARARSR